MSPTTGRTKPGDYFGAAGRPFTGKDPAWVNPDDVSNFPSRPARAAA
jgi:hypothetical protein